MPGDRVDGAACELGQAPRLPVNQDFNKPGAQEHADGLLDIFRHSRSDSPLMIT